MKKFCVLALALLMLVPAFALADKTAEISVQGTATVTADPDVVSITANASVSAKTVAQAQEQINAIVANVTEKLMELGVSGDDIVTQNYSYYPNYDYNIVGDGSTLIGYQASHTLTITCRNVEMLDSVVGVVTDCGMSEIYSIDYSIADRSALYRQALVLAIQAAGEKAEAMAQAAGVAIDHLETLTENGGYYDDAMVNASMDGAMYSMRAESTGIRAGTVGVQASVTAVYETVSK